VLQYNFNWDTLSAAAGITFFNFYFRLYKGSIRSAQVVDFLQALLRHIPGPLLIVWDRLSAHRSGMTRDFIAGQGDRLRVEYLPGYAPELNPVEYIVNKYRFSSAWPRTIARLSSASRFASRYSEETHWTKL
jgi:transposase